MEYLVIIMLLLVGAVLILMEFMIFPGVNIAGVIGLICIGIGVYFGYAFYGNTVGHIILSLTTLLGIIGTRYALRSDTWKKLSLKTKLEGSVEGVDSSVKEGDIGITLGRLAPMGNVQIGEVVVEAESQSGYVDTRQEVEVVKVFKNKIVVKLK